MNIDKHTQFYQQSYTHKIVVRAIIINNSNEILMQKVMLPKEGEIEEYWAMPGGVVNKSESLVNAILRETFEETGVVIEPTCVLGIKNWFRDKSTHPNDPYSHFGTDIIFGAKYLTGEFKPQIDEGIVKIKFCNKIELIKLTRNTLSPIVAYYERFLLDEGLPLHPIKENINGYNWRYDIY